MKKGWRFPCALAGAYLIWWAALAVSPVSRAVWWAENIPVMAVFAGLVLTCRLFRFTNWSYGLMAVWLFLHTLGGSYTFAEVPFGAVTDLFGFERNHFDRLAHFSVGLYGFAASEYLWRRRLAHPVVAGLFGLALVMSVACGYEIIEWWYAALAGGQAGVEFLGSQGDVWDAQKDMLGDTLGGLAALALYFALRPGLPQDGGTGRDGEGTWEKWKKTTERG